MWIDNYPMFVAGKASLERCFVEEAQRRGIPVVEAWQLFLLLPESIRRTNCFLDRLTKLWRYEFGEPIVLQQGYLFGPHDWQPVQNLARVLETARRLLSDDQLRRYLGRLAIPGKHEDALAEFQPALRFADDVTAEFEFKTGVKNRDVDWRLSKLGSAPVLIEVKRRVFDLIALTEATVEGHRSVDGAAPQPEHDPGLLFRQVEEKFPAADPDVQLQGVWIDTSLKQEISELQQAFYRLDATKVHFVVFGGWEPGIEVLIRRPKDDAVILALLNEEPRPGGWSFVRRER